MRTLLWSYLGWRRFPRELSTFEVRRFFSLGPADRQILRRRFRSRVRLGAAIQLGFVRMTGTMLEALDHMPRAVLAHVGQQLSLPAPELTTLRALYRRRKTLFEHQAWACSYAGLRWPEPVTLQAADGLTEIRGLVFRPSDFDPGRRYPLVDVVYGGPQAVYVPKGFAAADYMMAASLAELGFVVTILDGRGTPQRSRAFHLASYGAIETASDAADHVAGIAQLEARWPSIDPARVGIAGFSAGGYLAATALLRFPDTYKVSVAMSGNHDQRLFYHSWGERYQGFPVTDEFARQATAAHAASLRGKLLLMHGLMDQGVNPSATLQLTQALIDANRDFDELVFPRSGHAQSGYEMRHCWDYLVRHLTGQEPPREFLLQSAADWFEQETDRVRSGSVADRAPPASAVDGR